MHFLVSVFRWQDYSYAAHVQQPCVAYLNLANNLFASSCDSLRPIIAFCHLPLGLAIKLMAFGNAGHDTRAQAYLGHKNIQHTVRYLEPPELRAGANFHAPPFNRLSSLINGAADIRGGILQPAEVVRGHKGGSSPLSGVGAALRCWSALCLMSSTAWTRPSRLTLEPR